MTATRTAAFLTALSLLAVGCTGGDPAPAGQAAPPSPSNTSRPSPTAVSSGPVAHRLGETVPDATDGWRLRVTVHAYRQPAAPVDRPPDQGREWGAIDVQVCIDAEPAGMKTAVSWRPWAFVYADGVVAKPDASDGTFQAPQFPDDDRIVPVGRCVRGWVTIAVRKGVRPTLVEYQPKGVLVDWAL